MAKKIIFFKGKHILEIIFSFSGVIKQSKRLEMYNDQSYILEKI